MSDWKRTSHAVYWSIYGEHKCDLTVHESHACSDEGCQFHARRDQWTAWGFRYADQPLIGCRVVGPLSHPDSEEYFIAVTMEDDE